MNARIRRAGDIPLKLRYKILWSFLALVAAGLLGLAVTMSYTSDCPPAPILTASATPMKAIVYRCYGSPEVLALEDVSKPAAGDDELLVKVQAASVNPLDWHYMRGEPYVMRLMGAGIGAPKDHSMGVDFAGIVEAVGKNVTAYKVGDEVFGASGGAFGEYANVKQNRVTLKPDNATFEQAAAVPVAALTALQALRDKGRVKAGEKVLINGASGGVGTYAVQIAKALGAEVTGVCSTRNVDMVQSIGADHVIDYKRSDFTHGGQLYDVVVDIIGNHSLRAVRGVLNPGGRLVMVGGPSDDPWIGALRGPIKAMLLSPFVKEEIIFFVSSMNPDDLKVLADLMQSGRMTSVIDRRYKLSEAPEAVAYLETGRARGKVVITVR